MNELFKLVQDEMDRQEQKWGEQNHPDEWYFPILIEEIGEIGKAMLELHFQDSYHQHPGKVTEDDIDRELIQAMAVAMSWMECRKRRGGDDE